MTKTNINANKVGLAVGLVLGGMHLLWAVLVAFGWAQPLIDAVYRMHFLDLPIDVLPFDATTAVSLVVMTFVVGYIMGWAFGMIWNYLHRR